MLKLHDTEPVTRGTMARTAFGRPLFTVQIYVLDGWLVDCGPPATGGEIVRFAAIEAAAATWTWIALRSNTRTSPSHSPDG